MKKKNNTKIKSKKTKEKLLELPEKVIIVSHETDGKTISSNDSKIKNL